MKYFPKIAFIFASVCFMQTSNLAAQTTIFSENFTGATNWYYISFAGGTTNQWTIVTNACCYSAGSSLTVKQGSSTYCSYSKTVIADKMAYHMVNATGYESLQLSFRWKCTGEVISGTYYDYGSVWYSLDGITFSKVTAGGNGSGNYSSQSTWTSQSAFSLPSALNNQVFYLGFDWINDNSGGANPPFAVDDISVTGTANTTSTLLTQNFSTCALPASWTNTDNSGNGAGSWTFNNTCTRTIKTGTASNCFAKFDSDCYGNDGKAENADLITPSMNCSTYGVVNLCFQHYYYHLAGSQAEVLISGDGGSNWTSVATFTASTVNAQIKTIDISSVAAGNSSVKVKFHFTGNYSWYWAVDDIIVSGIPIINYTWTGTTSTNWNTSTNWSPSGIPGSSDNVTIPAGPSNMPIISATTTALCRNLTINSGASLTNQVVIATGEFTIAGSVTINGILYHTGDESMTLSGVGKTIGGDFLTADPDEIVAWIISGNASYTLNNDWITGQITIAEGSTLNTNGYNIECVVFNQQGDFVLNDDTLMLVGAAGDITFDDADFFEGTGTVWFNRADSDWSFWGPGNQTVPSMTYYNLCLSTYNTYTITLGGGTNFVIGNDLTLLNPSTIGGTVSTDAAGQITVTGNLIHGGAGNDGTTLIVNDQLVIEDYIASIGNDRTYNEIQVGYTSTSETFLDVNGVSPVSFVSPVTYLGGTQIILDADYTDLNIEGSGTRYLEGNITVDAENASGNPLDGDLTITTGELVSGGPPSVVPVTSSDADQSIPELVNGVAANNTVPTLASLNTNAVKLSITLGAGYIDHTLDGITLTATHTYNSDLDFYLVDPSSTVYVISTDNGGGDDGYSSATFSDNGATPIPTSGVITGDYQAEGMIMANYSASVVGTWKLFAIDDASIDVGQLTDFKINLFDPATSLVYTIDVEGDWTVSGGTFSNLDAQTTFDGSIAQTITSDDEHFGDINFQNSSAAGISLNGNLYVDGTASLNDGVVSTNGDTVFITNAAVNSIDVFSDNSFVNGNLNRVITGNVNYSFPVGNGTTSNDYHRVNVDNNSLAGVNNLTVSFESLTNHNDGDMNCSDDWLTYSSINNEGVWYVEPDAQPSSGAYDVYLYTQNFTGLADNEFAPLKRAVNSITGADWSTGDGDLNIEDGEGRLLSNGYALRMNMTSFSQFGQGQGFGGLPITLLSFTATKNNSFVDIDWTTLSEVNNDFFEVERSNDAINFVSIGIMDGAGNSTSILDYKLTDESPYLNLNYYRLKQTDYDGTHSYSEIRKVEFNSTSEVIDIYPNPTHGEITIASNNQLEIYNIQIFDVTGRMIHEISFDHPVTEAFINLTSVIPQGVYQLLISGDHEFQSVQRIIIY